MGHYAMDQADVLGGPMGTQASVVSDPIGIEV